MFVQDMLFKGAARHVGQSGGTTCPLKPVAKHRVGEFGKSILLFFLFVQLFVCLFGRTPPPPH